MTETTPYSIPKERGRWRAITLAALVHAVLFGFLWLGVRWQNEPPAAVEAEVWDMQAKEAAPAPEPQPAPPVKLEAKPEPKPVIKEAPPPPKIAEPQPLVAKPDIVLEQEKKRKEQEKKKRLEEERLAKLQQADEIRREKEAAEAAQKKIDAEQLKKSEAEKKRKDEARRAEEAEKKRKDEAKRKEEAEKKRKQDEADAEMLAKVREAEMRRITGVAGTGGTGEAARSQGSGRGDPGYANRVGARIKSNTIFNVSDSMKDNPPVEYLVELLPDGSVRGSPRKLKSSDVAGFDEAVRRAIERSQPYPPDNSGSVPSSFILSHRPKDQ